MNTSGDQGWRHRLHTIIFEADTPAGRAFDTLLIAAILLSVMIVMLESITHFRAEYAVQLRAAEWFFTFVFTVEYFARLISVRSPSKYARSFFGIVDLLAILPTYLSVFFAGAQSLLVIRVFRIVRVFRVFKLAHYLREANVLSVALRASRPKITVFLITVSATVVSMGSVMYLVEGPENGFTSIPVSVYWSIVTMTTVGYGDISPKTPLGQLLASLLMIVGYGIIAVPTGIVSVEIAKATRAVSGQACPNCSREGHDIDASFCKFCGGHL